MIWMTFHALSFSQFSSHTHEDVDSGLGKGRSIACNGIGVAGDSGVGQELSDTILIDFVLRIYQILCAAFSDSLM